MFKWYQGTFHLHTWLPVFGSGACVTFPFTECLLFHSTRPTLANNSAKGVTIVAYSKSQTLMTCKVSGVMEVNRQLMLTNEDLESKFPPHRSTQRQPCQAMQVYCSFSCFCTMYYTFKKFELTKMIIQTTEN